MSNEPIQQIRHAIVAALPKETSPFGRTPAPNEVYIPPSHTKALRPECNIVVGARGVGKTFWSSALVSPEIRKILGSAIPDLTRMTGYSGFGEKPNMDAYPDPDTFPTLLNEGCVAYDIWRAVLARWSVKILGESVPDDNWQATVAWVKSNPEQFGRLLEQVDAKFAQDNAFGMIVFDALDRSGSDWHTMDNIVSDLLRVILMLKRFPRLLGKVFLREDQYNRPITNFPDASKILATRVELTWAPQDLHGLLWHTLCNAPAGHGLIMREVYEQVVKSPSTQPLGENIWTIAEAAKRDIQLQRNLFKALAGEWMGENRRRGMTYTWSVGHLADGHGQTSPRSFLAALQAAAENSLTRYPDYPVVLHYESIKRGVQKASEIRVNELKEDYPWIERLRKPLRGLTVPCQFALIEEKWKEMDEPSQALFAGRPPEHWEEGWMGVRRDMESLGIFERMKDGRVNMPDLFRVGFGLGRRGGVKPVIRSSTE